MKFIRFTLTIMIAAAALIFSSCEDGNSTSYVQRNKVVILNQGNYTEQNASVYMYDEDSKELTVNAYSKANNGTKLGATLMSGTYTNAGVGYLLCANPDKLETVNVLTMGTIANPVTEGLLNTREVVAGDGYLFVTNAGENPVDVGGGYYEYPESFVSIYNITSSYAPVLVGKINVGSDAQGMAYADGTLYVGTKAGIVIISKQGADFVKDDVYADEVYKGAVKYLCISGDYIYASVPGCGVFKYDPSKGKATDYTEMTLSYDGFITADAAGNIYSYATTYAPDWSVESSDAYKLNVETGVVSKVATGEYLYSIGVSPYSGHIFTSEANGFYTNSTMNITDLATGNHIDSKTTGVGTFRYLFFSYLDIENPTTDKK